MLRTIERRPAIRTFHGWAISVLKKAGAIRECEEHGWMQDRADPRARERALDIARQYPPAGVIIYPPRFQLLRRHRLILRIRPRIIA
jgi:hypothetical protein